MDQNDKSNATEQARSEARRATEQARQAADKAKQAAEHTIEEIKVAGGQVVDRVRGLIEEGNVRRIRVVKDNRTLLEVPLTIAAGAGAAVVLLNPVLAALGALAALLTDVTLVVERDHDAAAKQTELADSPHSKSPQDVSSSKPETDHPGADAATQGPPY